jgi:hypothetical protein
MWNTLETIRKKPKQVRSQYAFWGAALCTLCIAIFWGFSIKDLFTKEVAEEVQKETESSFWAESKELFSSIGNLRYLFYGTIEYKAPTQEVPRQQMIDLNALIASSTKKEIQPTSTTTEKEGDIPL